MDTTALTATTTPPETKTGNYPVSPERLNELLGLMVNDLGAAVNGALVVLGDRLGIYASLAERGPSTSRQLAEVTGLNERQLREWLNAQSVSGYITHEAASGTFFLTAEQAAVFADPSSPAAMTGGFYSVSAVYHDERSSPRVSVAERAFLGAHTTVAFFVVWNGSFERVTRPT
jgi:hypothetical protein